ncbi:retrovirus-related pol polyprotein from transposon TNT 1-94 [Tanacetum coccineum]
MNVYKGRIPTKIELTLEQSQQGVSNDVLVSIEGLKNEQNVWIKGVLRINLGFFRPDTFRVILFSIYSDEWKSFQCHHQTAHRSRDVKNGKGDRQCFRCGDPNHLIRECPKPPKDKNQRAFVGGSWSDSGEEDDEKVKDDKCLVAHASSEVCSESSYFSDENSSIDDSALDNEYDNDEDVTTTRSPITTSSSPTPPNAPSKPHPPIKPHQAKRTHLLFNQNFQISPPSLNEPTSPHLLNPLLDNISDCFILNIKDYLTKFDPKSYEGVFLGYSQNSKAYIILNKHTRKVKESLNVTFDETPPPSKTLPLVDDDLDEEEAIKVTEKKNLENDIVDETLEVDEIINIKESRNHPLENVIGNLNQRTLRSQAQNQSNFFCFISTIEPKNVNEALGDESWIVAMQEELNQFVANDVWELVPQPRNMTIIGTKWVFRNKLDENGIVSRNKARLKAFFIKHEYKMGMVDNTLFTKKKSSNLIIVQIYVDDIIFGSTCQDMCDEFAKIMHDEFEMSMMGELNFFLGLQIKQMEDGIFFNQSKYIKEMLKKFGLEDSKQMKTPMSSDTKLTKDE